MIPEPTGESRAPQEPLAAAGQGLGAPVSDANAKRHFDAFETDFFQQGDDGVNLPAELYHPDDFYVARARRPLLSAPSLIGLTIASSGLALLACGALWRSNAPAGLQSTVAARPRVASAETVAKQSVEPAPVVIAATAMAPSPSPADKGAQVGTEPVGAVVNAGEAQVKPEPATAGKELVAVVQAEATAGKPEPPGTEGAPTAAESPPASAGQRCKQSIREKRNKQILALCPAAFAEEGNDAAVAVALAKAEFDRGRFAQARVWSRKAIAVNPDAAEAYVFAGGAEQNQGHRKAAKEAYLQYLRLAPSGRYAAELRTIVGSL
jgi:tetratricopeptide (TPR) repeat protein